MAIRMKRCQLDALALVPDLHFILVAHGVCSVICIQSSLVSGLSSDISYHVIRLHMFHCPDLPTLLLHLVYSICLQILWSRCIQNWSAGAGTDRDVIFFFFLIFLVGRNHIEIQCSRSHYSFYSSANICVVLKRQPCRELLLLS